MDSLRLVGKAVGWGVCLLFFLSWLITGGVTGYVHLSNIKSPTETAATATRLLPEARYTLKEIERLALEEKSSDIAGASSQRLEAMTAISGLTQDLEDLIARFCSDAVLTGCSMYNTSWGTEEEVRWAKKAVSYLERQSNQKNVMSNNIVRIQSLLFSTLLISLSGYMIYGLSRFKTLNIRRFSILFVLTIPVLLALAYMSLYVVQPGETSSESLAASWFSDLTIGVIFFYPFFILPPVYVLMKKSGATLKSILICWR